MKKYIVLWAILIVGIFCILTIYGFKYKKIIKYKKIEENMVNVAKSYLEESNIKVKNYKVVNLEELIKLNKKLSKEVEDNECSGKVIINKGIFNYKYKAKIFCKNYKTK